MKKYEVRPVETLVDILCDICGKSCKTPLEDFEYAALRAEWGYSSRKDGENHSTTMCENCFDEIAAHIARMVEQKQTIRNSPP